MEPAVIEAPPEFDDIPVEPIVAPVTPAQIIVWLQVNDDEL